MSGPDGIASSPLASRVDHSDVAIRTAERREVELHLRDRLPVFGMALLAALPPLTVPASDIAQPPTGEIKVVVHPTLQVSSLFAA